MRLYIIVYSALFFMGPYTHMEMRFPSLCKIPCKTFYLMKLMKYHTDNDTLTYNIRYTIIITIIKYYSAIYMNPLLIEIIV